MTLAELKNNETAIITKVKGRGKFRKRLTEMGFISGQKIEAIRKAPLQDPVEYQIMNYKVSLRQSEAELVEIVSQNQADKIIQETQPKTTGNKLLKKGADIKSKHINIALIGNPNCGKTTLFNELTGLQEHVGNYGGVTVNSKKGYYKQDGYTFEITDLPGTYSLTAYSPEELFVRQHIIDKVPDIVLNVTDGANLERNLYLTTRLIDMDIKVVMALNMFDQMQQNGDKFNTQEFSRITGIPTIPTTASTGVGKKELFRKIIEVYKDQDKDVKHIHIDYGEELENAIQEIQAPIKNQNNNLINKIAPRFLAISLLEKDKELKKIISKLKNGQEIITLSENLANKIENKTQNDTENLITDARYSFIKATLNKTFTQGTKKRYPLTKKIDNIVSHKIYGFPIFLFFMYLMFTATYTLGEYPMNWIDSGVSLLSDLVSAHMPEGLLKTLIIDGIIAGVGGVIIFLPNILILFLFISIMEDTGYMARVAFITDKLMQKIGLPGKAFIPMIMGFGCNVPAVMATRTLTNKNDRILTMLINPFVPCSARLPVFLIITGAIFPAHAGTMLFLIYLTGILLAITIAVTFKAIFFKKTTTPFIMEMPPYRMPVAKTILRHMWSKASQYLKKMGGIILIASIIIWALGAFPQETPETAKIQNQIDKIENQISSITDQSQTAQLQNQQAELQNTLKAQQTKGSYIGQIGKFIEPAIQPLGFDWRIGVSIFTGIAAKEIVVSTMGILYGVGEDIEENQSNLMKQIQNATYDSGKLKGKKIYTTPTSLAFLIFILVYFPCIATIIAIKKESNTKWAMFSALYTTSLAWILAFGVQQIGSLFI